MGIQCLLGVSVTTTGSLEPSSLDPLYHSDGAHGRILDYAVGGSATNTIQSCISACAAKGYTIAGTEYSS